MSTARSGLIGLIVLILIVLAGISSMAGTYNRLVRANQQVEGATWKRNTSGVSTSSQT